MDRAILDPGVLIAALLSPDGAPAEILRKWINGEFALIVSPKLLDELRTMLARPKFGKSVAADEAAAYLNLFEQTAVMIPETITSSRWTERRGRSTSYPVMPI